MKNTIFAIATLFSLASVFAANEQRGSSQQALTFSDLRMACQNPARFHNQSAPTNIQISCKDIQYKWVPDDGGTVKMANSRNLMTSVYSDKYTVYPTAKGTSSAQSAPCPQFKQVAEIVETVRALSCDELIAFTGSADDLCLGAVDALKGANKEAVAVSQTGQFFNLCDAKQGKQSQR